MDPRAEQLNVRISFVIPYFYPALQYGGQPRSAYDVARGLASRGHRIQVLTTDSAGEKRIPAEWIESHPAPCGPGIDVFYYRNISNHLAYRRRLFWPSRFFRELRGRLADADVVHIHELRSFLAVAAHSAALDRSIPYVISPHGGLRHLGKHLMKSCFDRIWGYSILKEAAVVAAVSELEQQDAIEFGIPHSRIRRLPNAIRSEEYEPLPAFGQFRARYGIGNQKLMLFLGRLHWIKGADLLIAAFADLVQSGQTDALLAIAGPDDGQEPELRQMVIERGIKDRVIFTGFLNDENKKQALVDSDCVVIPSRSEIFAITALEALMCETPVVLSSVCGLDPMPPADAGVLRFDPANRADLQAKLLDAVTPGFRPTAARGKDFVLKSFSIGKVAEQAESIYDSVVRATNGARERSFS